MDFIEYRRVFDVESYSCNNVNGLCDVSICT